MERSWGVLGEGGAGRDLIITVGTMATGVITVGTMATGVITLL